MKKVLLVMCCSFLAACAGLSGPQAADEDRRVRTLGVLPVMVDVESIAYGNRDGLVAVLNETSREVDDWLIEELREKGDYFDVRKIEADNGSTFGRLVASRALAGEGPERHRVYSFEPDGVTGLIDAHLVDAVVVVVVYGIERPEKRWSLQSARMEYLEADYRSLQYSAAVVAAPAEKLWHRPIPAGDTFLRLDYPDFIEAYWNRTDNVRIKEISLPGLQRALTEEETGLFVKSARPKLYAEMVRELVAELKNGL